MAPAASDPAEPAIAHCITFVRAFVLPDPRARPDTESAISVEDYDRPETGTHHANDISGWGSCSLTWPCHPGGEGTEQRRKKNSCLGLSWWDPISSAASERTATYTDLNRPADFHTVLTSTRPFPSSSTSTHTDTHPPAPTHTHLIHLTTLSARKSQRITGFLSLSITMWGLYIQRKPPLTHPGPSPSIHPHAPIWLPSPDRDQP